MNEDATHVRLLPRSGVHDRPCLLFTDGEGPVSRLADRVENVQLGLAGRLLGRTRDLLAAGGATGSDLGPLAGQLADALADVLLVAESRRRRLPGAYGHAPAYVLPGLRAHSLRTFPGQDLASARAARRHVRDTVQPWGLPAGAVDDLELITGELVANALEHTGGDTITVTCGLTAEAAAVGVTDEGESGAAVVPGAPGGEQEHGRGLLITDALAARWGSLRTGEGLTVWAEVPADVGEAVPSAGARRVR
ncbi:ATP-binding protein [Streptomyces sp. NPDC057433]|uniref:ATP-binding protein n=1 Tax=Streptomyces sp. NPDC057433 TaxID=3346132 RepID=UPI003673D1AD